MAESILDPNIIDQAVFHNMCHQRIKELEAQHAECLLYLTTRQSTQQALQYMNNVEQEKMVNQQFIDVYSDKLNLIKSHIDIILAYKDLADLNQALSERLHQIARSEKTH